MQTYNSVITFKVRRQGRAKSNVKLYTKYGLPEYVLILTLALLLFGTGRLPGIGKNIGPK